MLLQEANKGQHVVQVALPFTQFHVRWLELKNPFIDTFNRSFVDFDTFQHLLEVKRAAKVINVFDIDLSPPWLSRKNEPI